MRRRRSPVALLLAGALLLAEAGHASASPPPTPAPPQTEFVQGPTFTLLSGDRVRLDTAGDGSQQGEVVLDAGPPDDVRFHQIEGDLYALPGRAVRLIGEGRLDRELFNLTKLAEFGYDDASTPKLPLIATYPPAKAGRKAAAPRGTTMTRTLRAIDAATLAVDKKQASAAWADLTRPSSPALKVWLDGKVRASLDVSVPAVGAPQAWRAGLDGTGVRIAVLDTGIDAAHPDFAGRIAASRSFIAGEEVADVHGHGTHVASIALGAGGTYKGVAPGAELVVGKVLDNEGSGTDSEIIAGMEWAAAQGAKVINMSLTGSVTDGTDPLAQAVNRISDETGALFVIAAGNYEGQETVGSPGTADRALTVGGVDKTAPHPVGWYSSRGPRIVDHAVKPEITAPGTGIVAARTGGGHTSNQGTSMASPHVAGAAAILAQQHPDWTAGQLKDALVSTAEPNPGEGVTEQGGGMLDVARATTTDVVATGTLNLGAVEPPYAAAGGSVTFRNLSDEPVRADLALELRKGLAATEVYTPQDGAVTVEPSTVDIPAGGTATVRVTADIDRFDVAPYFGWLEARSGDSVLARTTVGWSKELPRHRLSVTGVDRLGVPASTVDCSFVEIMNLGTGEKISAWWQEGEVYTARYGGPDPLLPEGRYAVLANVCTYTARTPYYKLSDTIGGDPELVLDRDREIVIDARKAERLQEYRTDSPSEPLGHDDHEVWVIRQITVNHEDGAISHPAARLLSSGQEIYVVPNDSPITDGTFFAHYSSFRVAPALTMSAHGRGVPALHPWYPGEADPAGECGRRVLCFPPFDKRARYEIVHAGNGTPGELAAARVRGKLVLVNEVWGEQANWSTDAPSVDQVAADAATAGAAGVLVAAVHPGSHQRAQVRPVTIPVATLPMEEARRLAAAIERGPVLARAGGQPVTPYTYDIRYQRDTLTLPPVRVRNSDLARVDARYHADVPGSIATSGRPNNVSPDLTKFTVPHTRVEYHTPSTEAFSSGHTYDFLTAGGDSIREQVTREFKAGTRLTENYGSAPVAPGMEPPYRALVATNASTYRGFHGGLAVYKAPKNAQLSGWPLTGWGWRILRDGTVLCEGEAISNIACDPSGGAGRYRLEANWEQNVRSTSTATRTAWDFNARFDPPADGEARTEAAVPLVDLQYAVDLDLTNAVKAGWPYIARFAPGYQPGYTGERGPFTVEAWVSHDDGATWKPAGRERTESGEDARFLLRAARDAEFVTIRVRATDAAGNAVDQTITRAWKVSRR